ncbi:PASTA domain-containing protein [Arthrobacter sp. 9MFCol3.1]|uniref:PASTA domain-containing protein n=1 Tax=Arthrobacter sp. 9MFCol3.1 TaxID=1150398 RepID=UPI000686222A|nr:PASTA domain-containing protein [Arthrobacter sp. 9MFCol3.1]
MKRHISAVLAALLVAALTACGGGAQQAASSGDAAAAKNSRTVPDVIGKELVEARNSDLKDFVVNLFGKDGNKWLGYLPDNVTIVSTDPAAGSVTDKADIDVTVSVTEAEAAEADQKAQAQATEAAKMFDAKAQEAAAAEKLAARYTFDCSDTYSTSAGTQGIYKTLKQVWAAPEYKTSRTCRVEIDGEAAYGAKSLLPNERAVADVVVAHGGGTYDSPAGDFGTALELCAKPPVDYADRVGGRPSATRADAYGALALCPDAPHAELLRQVATTIKVGDGTNVVGKDMEPGTYRTKPGVKDCYWARSTGGGDIIANNFVGFAPNGVTVTVYAGEGFESQRCDVWTKIG